MARTGGADGGGWRLQILRASHLTASFGREPDIQEMFDTDGGKLGRKIWLVDDEVYSLRIGKALHSLLIAPRDRFLRLRQLEVPVEQADKAFADGERAANSTPPRIADAEASYHKALERVPYYLRAAARLGKVAYWRGGYEEARQILDDGLAAVRHPDIRGDLLYYRGLVATWAGETENAKAYFREDRDLNKHAYQGIAHLAALEGTWDKPTLKLAVRELRCAGATGQPDRPAQAAKEFPLTLEDATARLQGMMSPKEFQQFDAGLKGKCGAATPPL